MSTAPMPPALDDSTAEFRMLHCAVCDRWIHPVEARCSQHPEHAAPNATAATGTIYSLSVNHHAYLPDIALPYAIAIIDLDAPSSLRITTRLEGVEPDQVRIGDRVRATAGSDGRAIPTFTSI